MDLDTDGPHTDLFITARDALARTLLGLSTSYDLDSTQASHRLAIHHAETALTWTSTQNAAAAADRIEEYGQTPTITVYDEDGEESLYSHIHDDLLEYIEKQHAPIGRLLHHLPDMAGVVLKTLIRRRLPVTDSVLPVGGLTPAAVDRIRARESKPEARVIRIEIDQPIPFVASHDDFVESLITAVRKK